MTTLEERSTLSTVVWAYWTFISHLEKEQEFKDILKETSLEFPPTASDTIDISIHKGSQKSPDGGHACSRKLAPIYNVSEPRSRVKALWLYFGKMPFIFLNSPKNNRLFDPGTYSVEEIPRPGGDSRRDQAFYLALETRLPKNERNSCLMIFRLASPEPHCSSLLSQDWETFTKRFRPAGHSTLTPHIVTVSRQKIRRPSQSKIINSESSTVPKASPPYPSSDTGTPRSYVHPDTAAPSSVEGEHVHARRLPGRVKHALNAAQLIAYVYSGVRGKPSDDPVEELGKRSVWNAYKKCRDLASGRGYRYQ